MSSPCSENCVTYAICKQRLPNQKFDTCSIYAQHIVESIKSEQDDIDAKEGKGRFTVVAIKLEGEPCGIDADGNALAGFTGEE